MKRTCKKLQDMASTDAREFLLASIPSEVNIGIMSVALPWFGPHWWAAFVFGSNCIGSVLGYIACATEYG